MSHAGSFCPCRFECLKLKCLSDPILSKYCEVLGKFSSDIDKIQRVSVDVYPCSVCSLSMWIQLYHEQCENPPVGYNMPPISGKVLWAHQLLMHMEQPMNLLKVHEKLLQTAHGKAVVKKYNKLALLLTEYELVGYNRWVQVVESTCNNLQVTVPCHVE